MVHLELSPSWSASASQSIQIGEDEVKYSGINPLIFEKGTLRLDAGGEISLSLLAYRLVLSSDTNPIPFPLAAVVAMSVFGSAEIRSDESR